MGLFCSLGAMTPDVWRWLAEAARAERAHRAALLGYLGDGVSLAEALRRADGAHPMPRPPWADGGSR